MFATLGPALPTSLRLTNESPSNLGEFHAHIPITHPQAGYLTTPNGGLGYGLPAAVGAAIADPSIPVLATIGEGSLQYTGQALWTAARERANVVVLVLHNNEYDILKAFADFEKVQHVPGLNIPGLDTVSYSRGYGVDGERVESPDAVRDAVVKALKDGGPHLIEVPISSSVVPLI